MMRVADQGPPDPPEGPWKQWIPLPTCVEVQLEACPVVNRSPPNKTQPTLTTQLSLPSIMAYPPELLGRKPFDFRQTRLHDAGMIKHMTLPLASPRHAHELIALLDGARLGRVTILHQVEHLQP